MSVPIDQGAHLCRCIGRRRILSARGSEPEAEEPDAKERHGKSVALFSSWASDGLLLWEGGVFKWFVVLAVRWSLWTGH